MMKSFTSTAFIAAALCLPLAGCEVETQDAEIPVTTPPGVEAPDETPPADDLTTQDEMANDDAAVEGEMAE